MAGLTINIPAGHAAHWKLRPDGVLEVEMMLVISPFSARWIALEKARGADQFAPQSYRRG
jgi:hypothetical protein